MSLIDKIFGTHSEREVKRIEPIVDKIMNRRELSPERQKNLSQDLKQARLWMIFYLKPMHL